jgi:hypothetical protein
VTGWKVKTMKVGINFAVLQSYEHVQGPVTIAECSSRIPREKKIGRHVQISNSVIVLKEIRLL